MRNLVQFELADDGIIWVEVDDPEVIAGLAPSRRRDVFGEAKVKFEDAFEVIKPTATAIVNKIKEISDPPHKIEAEFGLNLSAEAGAFIASSSVEAGFKVKLTWENKNQAKSKPHVA